MSTQERIYSFVKENRYLVLVLVLGSVLRLILLSQNPPSLNWDEVSHGYNAYSILKTGKDEWGNFLPLIFRAYGDYKLPSYIYLTLIPIYFLGLNSLSVRLISILAGILTILFTYLLAKKIFGEKVGLLSAFLVAIEPWSLFLSRGAFEANLALTFVVSGIYYFLEGLKKPKKLIASALLLGLSLWTYNSARVFVPLLVISILLIYKDSLLIIWKKNRKISYLSILIILLFFIPMLWQLINPIGQARYSWVAVLDEGAISQINEARVSSDLPQPLNILLNNKATFFSKRFISNWISHFNPVFLFIKGGTHYQFSIPNTGLINWINAPLLLFGLFHLAKSKGKKRLLLFSWLLLAPIPSSLTREAPHVLRSITLLPIPMIVSSYGFWMIYKRVNYKRILIIGYFLILSIFFGKYAQSYLNEYRNNYSWAWQYGYKQATEYIKENYSSYEKIIMTKKYGEPHEFILFYWPWEPESYQDDSNLVRFYQSDWYWVDRFDKFYFVNDWEIPKNEWENFALESGSEINCEGVKCLLITSPENHPKTWSKLKTINYLNGQKAFEIYEN